MSARLLACVIVLTRAWVLMHTCHAPRVDAEARSAEIESDVWEMLHDPDLGSPARRIRIAASRLCLGIPEDLAWACEHLPPREQLLLRRVLAVTAATVMVLTLLAAPTWLFNGRREVVACAATAPSPSTTADLRYEVIRCAGAFFLSAR
jgi:hypothetical protein